MTILESSSLVANTQFMLLFAYSIVTLNKIPMMPKHTDYWMLQIIFITIPSLISVYGINCISQSSFDDMEVAHGAFSILFSILYVSVYISVFIAQITASLFSKKSSHLLYYLLFLWSLTAMYHIYLIIKIKSTNIYNQLTKNRIILVLNYSILILLALASFGIVQFSDNWKINYISKSIGVGINGFVHYTVYIHPNFESLGDGPKKFRRLSF